MKAYNTPKDELHIESDTGETLVSITTDKTTIANLEGGGSNVVANPSPAGSTKLTGLQIDDTKYKVFSTVLLEKTAEQRTSLQPYHAAHIHLLCQTNQYIVRFYMTIDHEQNL